MRHRFLATLSALALSAICADAMAASTACPASFLEGVAPDVTPTKISVGAVALCFSKFSTLHSPATHDPIYSAAHLTHEGVTAAGKMVRNDAFHVEKALPPGESSDPKEFVKSGFDKGHVEPSGDAPDSKSQYETFSMANMVPQAPNNNRHLWEGTENTTRQLAIDHGDVYVVTGPVIQTGMQYELLDDRVVIPKMLFKAVYVPELKQGGVYLENNAPGDEWHVISFSQLKSLTGIDPFPSLPQEIKDKALALPAPHPGTTSEGGQAKAESPRKKH